MLPIHQIIRLPEQTRPVLLVVVDTEEEFDWNADFSRTATSVTALREIGLAQALFDEFAIRPTYAIDYPVASSPREAAAIKEYRDQGRAEIGIQMHPWVNPPFDEAPTSANSYQGNLQPELERSKLKVLIDTVRENFSVVPQIHKAGRYGFGSNTARILSELGIRFDLSLCPAFDFSDDGGPDYTAATADLYWFGDNQDLLGIPTTAGFVGHLRPVGPKLYPLLNADGLAKPRVRSMLAQLGALERMRLSPEGHTLADNKKLTRALLAQGIRVFTFSFHSPSLKPNCTPYVNSEREREDFLARIRRYFEFFLGELNGVAMTPPALLDHLKNGAATADPLATNHLAS